MPRRGDLAELEALGLVAHLLDQLHQRPQRRAGRGQRLAGRDRAVGLDVEHEAVVVGRLLDRVGSTVNDTRRTGEKIESTGMTPMVPASRLASRRGSRGHARR